MSIAYNPGPMMTLAALAATAPAARPSGESLEVHTQRILNGINSLLADNSLATAGLWQAVWVGLSPDGANLSFIAQCTSQNAFAVGIRGTQFTSLIDLGEDLEPQTLAQFTPGDVPLLVSQGSMKGFTEVIGTVGVPSGNLLQTLTALLGAAPSNATLYVTGHSLGGALATMVALYLAAQTWSNPPVFGVYTFAAPSAGLQSFADYYDQTLTNNSPNQTWRVYNAWDAVPNAWATLSNVKKKFYPVPSASDPTNPGPAKTSAVSILLGQFEKLPNGNHYVQTNGNSSKSPNTKVLNSKYASYDPSCVYKTTESFMGQVAYQHNCYLSLLEVKNLPAVGDLGGPPKVTKVSPNNGPVAGGVSVTISGGYFTSDCVVDFGNVAGTVVDFTPTQITAISPPGAGTVDVRVTNMYGTSAATPADQFAAPSPLAPSVTSVTPAGGPPVPPFIPPPPFRPPLPDPSYAVSVIGTGFVLPADSTVVNFGTNNEGSSVKVLSLTELTVVPPMTGSGIVDVTVTNSLGASATETGDRFSFGTPIVTSVSPSSGPMKNASLVTIKGFGFTKGCTVSFGNNKTTNVTINSEGTAIKATPPDIDTAKSKTVDVTVTTTDGLTSATVPEDEYTYYPAKK